MPVQKVNEAQQTMVEYHAAPRPDAKRLLRAATTSSAGVVEKGGGCNSAWKASIRLTPTSARIIEKLSDPQQRRHME